MNTPLQFVLSARRVRLVIEEEPTHRVENTVLVFCEADCKQLIPHYVRDGYRECSCCFNRVYPKGVQDA